ncbi:hypothetical protein [Corynebacterium sp.]|jgi:hypothetical protein|nr:hypothetical protein [Corynebacterium sp.]
MLPSTFIPVTILDWVIVFAARFLSDPFSSETGSGQALSSLFRP